jgi:dTDP-glucose 4,6-dehydratase
MKVIVITGCAGFIGSYVTEKCLRAGYKVCGIDKYTYASNPYMIEQFKKEYPEDFQFVQKDISELKYIPDCDYVINIAAETHVGNSIVDSTDFIKSNVEGVKNLLDVLKVKPSNVQTKPVFFHFSTDEVYGDIADGEHTEQDLLNPSNPYSASKASSDMLIKAWSRTYGIEYIILRPTNNYGLRQYPEKLIPLCVNLLQRNKKIRLHNEGTPIRNWLHAQDTAAAVMTIMNSGVKNEIFNVAGSFEQTNRITVKKIIETYYNDKNIEWESYVDMAYTREGQDVRYALNDDKLRQLGWKPTMDFDVEITNVVEFYKKHFRW